jgi:hypothetical protein
VDDSANDCGHLFRVSSAAGSTALTRYPGTSILRQATTTAGGNVVRRETRTVDLAGRITGVHTAAASGTLAAAGYTVDDLGRRTTARREDGSTWTYGYNGRSEVISGSKALPGTPPILAAGQQFDYSYDDIGNRKLPVAPQEGPPLVGEEDRQIGYQANALNQYTSITTPRSLDVLVRAPEAEISVTSGSNDVEMTQRQGADYHRAEITVTGQDAANSHWIPVDVTAGSLST